MIFLLLIFSTKTIKCINLGDNCIQNFHLWRYIVGYKVRCFTAMCKQSHKTLSDDIASKMKILNMAIPTLTVLQKIPAN